MKFGQLMDKIERNVMQILVDYPEARGNDMFLEQKYRQKHEGLEITDEQIHFRVTHWVKSESIRRSRQKIQERKLLLPSEEVQRHRAEQQELFKNRYKKNQNGKGGDNEKN